MVKFSDDIKLVCFGG